MIFSGLQPKTKYFCLKDNNIGMAMRLSTKMSQALKLFFGDGISNLHQSFVDAPV